MKFYKYTTIYGADINDCLEILNEKNKILLEEYELSPVSHLNEKDRKFYEPLFFVDDRLVIRR